MLCSNSKAMILMTGSPPPALVGFNQFYEVDYRPLVYACPTTHFRCNRNGYCFPIFLRCNGFIDCPEHEDEFNCEEYRCPGHFRCRGSRICLHKDHVCDNLAHCPRRDDELTCASDLDCPTGCLCYGLTLICRGLTHASLADSEVKNPDNDTDENSILNMTEYDVFTMTYIRYLHSPESDLALEVFADYSMLIHLGLPRCKLQRLHDTVLPNLQSLDISSNRLHAVNISLLSHFHNLRVLSLSKNPLMWSVFHDSMKANVRLKRLTTMDLSFTRSKTLHMDIVALFPQIQHLNLSNAAIYNIMANETSKPKQITSLDIRGSPVVHYPRHLFRDVIHVQFIRTDNPKLCCSIMFPEHYEADCVTPTTGISTCGSLLNSRAYRVVLAMFATLSLAGNMGSFISRVFVYKTATKSSFAIFVLHLCMSDFLMGVYLAVIGVADRWFGEEYTWEELTWRNSFMCHLAGVLCFLSTELSYLVICIITLERYLVLRFPFSRLDYSLTTTHLVALVVWSLALLLSVIPLLPSATSHGSPYGQTATCFDLPLTPITNPGQAYMFGVMIVFNCLLCAFLLFCQVCIYLFVRENAMSASCQTGKSRNADVARRLIAIAVSNLICWFPVGLTGFLAVSGHPVSSRLSQDLTVSVLPFNSAANPFLYTVNVILEARRLGRERALLKELSAFKNKS